MVQQQTSFKVAEVEVNYKSNYNITERPKISSSQDAYRILCNNGNQEERYNKLLVSYI